MSLGFVGLFVGLFVCFVGGGVGFFCLVFVLFVCLILFSQQLH